MKPSFLRSTSAGSPRTSPSPGPPARPSYGGGPVFPHQQSWLMAPLYVNHAKKRVVSYTLIAERRGGGFQSDHTIDVIIAVRTAAREWLAINEGDQQVPQDWEPFVIAIATMSEQGFMGDELVPGSEDYGIASLTSGWIFNELLWGRILKAVPTQLAEEVEQLGKWLYRRGVLRITPLSPSEATRIAGGAIPVKFYSNGRSHRVLLNGDDLKSLVDTAEPYDDHDLVAAGNQGRNLMLYSKTLEAFYAVGVFYVFSREKVRMRTPTVGLSNVSVACTRTEPHMLYRSRAHPRRVRSVVITPGGMGDDAEGEIVLGCSNNVPRVGYGTNNEPADLVPSSQPCLIRPGKDAFSRPRGRDALPLGCISAGGLDLVVIPPLVTGGMPIIEYVNDESNTRGGISVSAYTGSFRVCGPEERARLRVPFWNYYNCILVASMLADIISVVYTGLLIYALLTTELSIPQVVSLGFEAYAELATRTITIVFARKKPWHTLLLSAVAPVHYVCANLDDRPNEECFFPQWRHWWWRAPLRMEALSGIVSAISAIFETTLQDSDVSLTIIAAIGAFLGVGGGLITAVGYELIGMDVQQRLARTLCVYLLLYMYGLAVQLVYFLNFWDDNQIAWLAVLGAGAGVTETIVICASVIAVIHKVGEGEPGKVRARLLGAGPFRGCYSMLRAVARADTEDDRVVVLRRDGEGPDMVWASVPYLTALRSAPPGSVFTQLDFSSLDNIDREQVQLRQGNRTYYCSREDEYGSGRVHEGFPMTFMGTGILSVWRPSSFLSSGGHFLAHQKEGTDLVFPTM